MNQAERQLPERLWLLSIALRKRGHRRLALMVKRLNALLFHNSLPINATVSPDVKFGHHGFGNIIHDGVVIGRRVKIWHHVTLAVRGLPGVKNRIVIEDDVRIGTGCVVITNRGESIRIGRGARIGAGTVVTEDVPPGATVVSGRPQLLTDRAEDRLAKLTERFGENSGFGE
jgi:serine O-acetyltransferase